MFQPTYTELDTLLIILVVGGKYRNAATCFQMVGRCLLVKSEVLQDLAERAYLTYLRSIHIQQAKEVFYVMKLPIEALSALLGLPMTPKIRFLKQKTEGK